MKFCKLESACFASTTSREIVFELFSDFKQTNKNQKANMGKKLDAFLGKISFKKSKFSNLVNLAVSRIAALEKQHHVRCDQARSDVIQLLNLGHQERALLRVISIIDVIFCSSLSLFRILSKFFVGFLTGWGCHQGAKHVGCICYDRKLLPSLGGEGCTYSKQ